MRKTILAAIIALSTTVMQTIASVPQAVVDSVSHILVGQNPLAELDSANVYLITRAEIDYEQYEYIFGNYMIPFALKNRDRIPDADLAWLYRNYSIIFAMQEKTDREIAAIDSAVLLIENVDDEPATKAAIYANAGDSQIRSGSIELGHKMYFKAIDIYEQMGDSDMQISNCLYQLAVGYLQMLDFDGLEYVIGKMQDLCGKPDADPNCLYDLYSVKTALFAIRHDRDPGNKSLSDSTLFYSRKSLDIIENDGDKLRSRVVPSWNYYNHARTLFHAPGIVQYDSVATYIDKALKALRNEGNVDNEVHISVYILQGEMARQQGDYAKAENLSAKAMELLDKYPGKNSLVVEREELYKLLADVYEATHRYRDAVKYRRLAEGVMAQRFDSEKVEALKQLEVKYEVEKKEATIATLEERNIATRRILLLTDTVAVILAVTIILVIRISRLRRRNIEQRLYEAALLAELRQDELENARKQIERQTAAKESPGTFAPVIGKLETILASAPIDSTQKDAYATKLQQLDATRLDNDFGDITVQMTQMDLKYALCFYIGMEVKHIASLFNVEPASVYTVRYRMRKKFRDAAAFRFLM